ncbi:MAG TPA: signal peptidase I [Clostridiales bacterium UBA8153]|nr:signal peptidase I [Clostridiales bacterium UBA8153]
MKRALREILETILLALVIALLIRGFVMESFVVQGSSMERTLFGGERLLVDKLSYRVRLPRPGEIIVFRDPRAPGRDYIKRVVAVAGETIEIDRGRVYVDGRAVFEPDLMRWGMANFPPLLVPEGEVFVLGDNRGNSDDSRAFGPVPAELIRGRAFFVFWPPGRARFIFHVSRRQATAPPG